MDRYKEPLVWIDLEMTGLNIETDTILEIAVILTDNDLNVIAEGPTFIIQHNKEKLDQMDEWNTTHHGASGLTAAALKSTTTLEQAELAVLEFLKKNTEKNRSPLCGNSIWQDKIFLTKYMPKVANFLNYRIIDVSSIKEVILRMFPSSPFKRYVKPENHRAKEDIKYSIQELKFYIDYFFIEKIF